MGASSDTGSTADAALCQNFYLIAGTIDAVFDRAGGYACMAIDTFILNDLNDRIHFFVH
jgi:hypothetical protein